MSSVTTASTSTLNTTLLKQLPKSPAQKSSWSHASSEALAHALSLLSQDFAQPILVVCANSEAAEALEQQLNFFLNDSDDVLHFPDWETLPYDTFSPHQDIISQRLRCLVQLPRSKNAVLVTSINSLMQPLAPQSFIDRHTLVLEVGQEIKPEQLNMNFVNAGYNAVHTVYEHGEFVSRGSIIDVFPMGSKQPIRIDFLGDEIDSLRYFDTDTQISGEKVSHIALLPRHEYPLDDDGINNFLDHWHERFEPQFSDSHESVIYQDIKQGIASPGLEYYLPLFFKNCANLLDYLPEESLVLYHQDSQQSSQHYWQEIQQRFEDRRHDRMRPLIAPQDLFFGTEKIFAQFKHFKRIVFQTSTDNSQSDSKQKNAIENSQQHFALPYLEHPDIAVNNKSENSLEKFKHYLAQENTRFLLSTYSRGRRVALEELLAHQDIKATSCDSWAEFLDSTAPLVLCASPLEQGFLLERGALCEHNIALISEDLIFGKRPVTQKGGKKSTQQEATLRHISELHKNTHVVHIEHGIGIYRGLETLTIDNQATELLLIEYADNTKLYVPVSSLHLIHHYQGKNTDHVALDKLGNEQWQKNKRKAAEKIHDVAVELLHSYAKREARQGFQYPFDENAYERFSNEFSFTETDHQLIAIKSVISDMQSKNPMDRLVCGDVGFGKTEVAMRAAFIAVHAGKQVGVLVPTTLLAQQHFENFRDRFSNWPIKIDLLSRFRSAKETAQTREALASGRVDIVIGTHKLLQEQIEFKNLGLMVVDEEHRFGVRQKERIKALKSEVDILTLTATPIPRTLNMSLHSLRDLSIMTTPPAKRLSVKTFVRAHDEALIKEAVLRELLRGGQVFYLHNDVKTMQHTVDNLQTLVPEARISLAHGQMREKELERIMTDFYHKRSNVLVCSTIIETGIDIPSANTIIMDRADKLGLAQLHQLRGRVGRSHHQAYAYLLTPQHAKITKDAEKRLLAIQEASDLGAGFMLAQHDLEIRGAGELLGEEQSGQMQKIGFSLYMQLLEETIESIRQGKVADIDSLIKTGCEINLNIPALIPEEYLRDPHNRLLLYKRISEAKNNDQLDQLKIEMIDRFGLLPVEINQLFAVTHIKLEAMKMGIDKVLGNSRSIQIVFSKQTKVDPLKLVTLVQQSPSDYKLKGSDQLAYVVETDNAAQRLESTYALLAALS